jgi:hypothetical protein
MVVFPVYVRDDANDVMSFPSHEAMQAYLELIDVENDEYQAWDANGYALDLLVGSPKSEWLKLTRTDRKLSQSELTKIESEVRTTST